MRFKQYPIILVWLLSFFSFPASAQRFLTEVFPQAAKTSDIIYGSNYSVLSGIPTLTDLKCDVYQPAGVTDTMARRPLIIYVHGGQFLPAYLNGTLEGGRNDSGIAEMCRQFARRGYVVANIDYRLGWNPAGSSVDIRRGTLIQAVYRAIQDVKAAVRYFRKDAATANLYHIDSGKVIVGGQYTGGIIALNDAALTSQLQISIPKYISNVNDPTYGFQTGLPYIDAAVMGDLEGYGGDPGKNNPNNSPGYGSKPNFVFTLEAIVGDSSWITPGLPPIVSFHRMNNPNTPYGNGIIYVLVGTPQSVVDVSGSGVFIPLTNAKGNNDCYRFRNFTDPYSQKALSLSGGVPGLYPFMEMTSSVNWWDSTASVTECMSQGFSQSLCTTVYTNMNPLNGKGRALQYIDTVMHFLNPRIATCLGLATVGVKEQAGWESGIRLYPNPASGGLHISSEGAENEITGVTFRDIAGRIVQQHSTGATSKLFFPLNSLPSGLYLVTVLTRKGSVVRKLTVL